MKDFLDNTWWSSLRLLSCDGLIKCKKKDIIFIPDGVVIHNSYFRDGSIFKIYNSINQLIWKKVQS